ncbi:hypothetical protein EYF80_015262 [Liparis tanakae]|uniref:Uncharacterized protein n=1 Tax=Liparis tanakae TaxID=230148 RepID=A0A4Z2IAR0_9TELE|nr:hypothetical protein EYF80_015262 [Liparis tanakae]
MKRELHRLYPAQRSWEEHSDPVRLSLCPRAETRRPVLCLLQSGCLWRPWRWAASCSCCCLVCVGVSAVLTPAAATSAAGAALTLAAALDTCTRQVKVSRRGPPLRPTLHTLSLVSRQ